MKQQPPFGGFLTSKIYKLICIIDYTLINKTSYNDIIQRKELIKWRSQYQHLRF